MNKTYFTDKAKRQWESFIDVSYYDCTVVKLVDDKDFMSPTTFHFVTSSLASAFIELLKESF